jgi:hypothetical protein
VITVSDLFTGAYKVPDLIGVDENNRVVIAEVEKDKAKFFGALGRCMLWRCTATLVYLVYPKSKISRAPFLSKVGIGLLEGHEFNAVTELIALPREGDELRRVWELHPTDFVIWSSKSRRQPSAFSRFDHDLSGSLGLLWEAVLLAGRHLHERFNAPERECSDNNFQLFLQNRNIEFSRDRLVSFFRKPRGITYVTYLVCPRRRTCNLNSSEFRFGALKATRLN